MRLAHEALPEIALADVDVATTFLGHALRAPLMISSMTGGTARAAEKLDGAISEALENPPKPVVKLAQPTVSHHMRILEKSGVVEAKREGHWRWYRRNEKLITEMMRGLKGQL